MSRVVLNRLLFLITVIFVLFAWFLRRDFAEPNYVFTPEMVFSVPYDSFASNPYFNDGKTLQLPVAGTVARGATLFEYEATEADALRAGQELANPWTEFGVDPDELAAAESRGRKVYSTFCLVCHGAVGNGDGPVTMHGFPPPPSLSLENSINMTDGQMFHVLTFGQKNMPAYAAQVSAEDRWKVILHVRALQEPAVLKLEADRLTQASIDAGEKVFKRLNCHKCHTVEPGEKPVGPYLGKVTQVYTREQLHDAILHPSKTIAEGFVAEVFLTFDGFTHSGFVTAETEEQVTIRNSDGNEIIIPIDDIDDRRTLEKSPMPEGMINDLPDQELQSLLDYLKSISGPPATDESASDEQPEIATNGPAEVDKENTSSSSRDQE